MPRRNAFYAYEPCSEEAKTVCIENHIFKSFQICPYSFKEKKIKQDEISSPIRLCLVCGNRAPLACGKCKLANYCGAVHQKIDWTLGEHKKICGTVDFDIHKLIGNPKQNVLFEEFELVTDAEQLDDTIDDESDEQAEERRLKDYEKFVAEQKVNATDVDLKDVPDEEFTKYSSQIDEDVVFGKFKKRIALDEEQVNCCASFCVYFSFAHSKYSSIFNIGSAIRS